MLKFIGDYPLGLLRLPQDGKIYPIVTSLGIQELYYKNKKFYTKIGLDLTYLVVFDTYYTGRAPGII
jgi:hypothetical protein